MVAKSTTTSAAFSGLSTARHVRKSLRYAVGSTSHSRMSERPEHTPAFTHLQDEVMCLLSPPNEFVASEQTDGARRPSQLAGTTSSRWVNRVAEAVENSRFLEQGAGHKWNPKPSSLTDIWEEFSLGIDASGVSDKPQQ
ncbi:hypothetical protein CEXT_627201 [Caerostris extrusa]|uniref:Uncharacterized protein n=1 Tax=Caerostris extrusa TaxID=172846 RepID=A0AAV4X364_CAEEX|nr:hypothetical protein CEXT_627201 [Caerostris extrusa]